MKSKPTIIIIGGTIWGNRGAEAMLVTTIGRIRQDFPNAEFNVFSYYPHQDSQLISDPHVHIHDGTPLSLVLNHFFGALTYKFFSLLGINLRFLKIASVLDQSDILLDIGGITFADGREMFLPFNILSIWPAILLGTPVIKLAQAVGPFEHAFNRILARNFLSRCKHIFLRGSSSARHITRLNLPAGKTSPAADIAFLYKPAYSLSAENIPRINILLDRIQQEKSKGKKLIIISPSILVDQKMHKMNRNYIDLLLMALARLNRDDFFYIFMPNATREGSSKHHNNDILLVNRIMRNAEQSNLPQPLQNAIAFIDYDLNSHAIRQVTEQADLLITSRYHAMISGLALTIPTIVIGWGHKYQETMAAFGLSQFVLNSSDPDLDLTEMIKKALESNPQIRKHLQCHLPVVRQLADNQFVAISQYLK